MLSDKYGNLAGGTGGSSVDSFGRLRVGEPHTIFEASVRYVITGEKFSSQNTASNTSITLSANEGCANLSISTANGDYIYRETKKVMGYQPGKSLLIMNSFTMAPPQTNLRQRIGYFGANNGFFLERSDNVYFVERSSVTGSVQDTKTAQSDWNIDPLDGTGQSGLTLDLDSPQILFIDIEWLGVGSVRMGFVINGRLIHCHTFHHANISTAPKGAYIQTACLPLRMEIENTAATASNSTLKRICGTVISEGGYELTGKPRIIGQLPTNSNSISLDTAGTFYPVVSIKLHSNTMDAIVLPKQIDLLPITAANYRWEIVEGATIAGAVWANVSSSATPVQYNTNTSATMSGGTVLNGGYLTSTVQGGGYLNLTDGIFKYQLERDTFANTTTTWTLAVAAGTSTSNVCGQILWEELT